MSAPAAAAALALGAAALALALAGGVPSPAPPAAAAARPAAVSLSVRYDDGAGDLRSGRLTCDAHGSRATGALAGHGVSAARQCARVRAIRGLLVHAPAGSRICTQIYGGPEILRVSGTIGNARVRRRYKRTNGCEIADFARVVHALPIAP